MFAVQCLKGFTLEVDPTAWKEVQPVRRRNKLRMQRGWTNVLAKKFQEKIYSCVLTFKSHYVNDPENVGKRLGTGERCMFVRAEARCKKTGCPAVYIFKLSQVPEFEKGKGAVFDVM